MATVFKKLSSAAILSIVVSSIWTGATGGAKPQSVAESLLVQVEIAIRMSTALCMAIKQYM